QRDPRAISQRHAVAVFDVGVGRERENAAAAAGGEDHGFGGNRERLARFELDGYYALAAPVVHQELGHKALVVTLNRIVLQRRLEERVQHVEAGLVGGEPGALRLHAAERADGHVTVGLAAPGASPVLEL